MGFSGNKVQKIEVLKDESVVALTNKINFVGLSVELDTDVVTVKGGVYQPKWAEIIITPTNISEKKLSIPGTVPYPNLVRFLPHDGIEQIKGIDFDVLNGSIIWEGLGLDGFLEVDDKIYIFF